METLVIILCFLGLEFFLLPLLSSCTVCIDDERSENSAEYDVDDGDSEVRCGAKEEEEEWKED